MSEQIKKYGRNSLMISLLLCVVAILIIFAPETFLTIVTTLTGIVLIVLGVVHIISYFKTDLEFRTFSMELVQGIIMTILGIILVANPFAITSVLLVVAGIWIILESIVRIQLAINIKSQLGKSFTWVLLLAILTLIVGILMIFDPFGSFMVITTLVGILMLVNEIVNIIQAIMILRIK